MRHSHDYQLTALTRNPFFIPEVQNNCQGLTGMVGWLFIWCGFFGSAPSRHKCAGHYRSANVEQLTNSQIFQAAKANCLYFPFEEIKIRVLRSPCCSKFCYFVVDVPCLCIPVLN